MYAQGYQAPGYGYGNNVGYDQPLPFDAQNQQIGDFDPNSQVPFAAIQTHPQLQPQLPAMANYMVRVIQETKAQNVLRMFLFNQLAQNAYQNPEFVEFFTVTVDAVHAALTASGGANQGQVIEQVIQRMVSARASANIKLYPALFRLLDPNQGQSAQQGLRCWQEACAQSQTVRNPMGQQGFGFQPTGAVGFAVGFNTVGAVPFQAGRPHNPNERTGLFSGGQMQQPMPQPSTVAASGFQAADRYAQQLQERMARDEARKAETAVLTATRGGYNGPTFGGTDPSSQMNMQPFKARNESVSTVLEGDPTMKRNIIQVNAVGQAQVVQQKQEEQPELFLSPEELSARGLKWQPSAQQPYHPSHVMSKQHVVYGVYKDGRVVAAIANQPQQNSMDQQAHSLSGRVPTAAALFVKPEDPIRVTSINEIAKIVVVSSDDQSFHLTEAEAHFNSSMEARLQRHVTAPDTAFLKLSYISEPIVTESVQVANHYRNLAREIVKSRTFDRAREILLGMKAPEEVLLFNRLNHRLTIKINEVLRMQMGLGHIQIDDFCGDLMDLLSGLKDSLGENVARALTNHQSEIIVATCTMISDEDSYHFARRLNDLDDTDGEGQLLELSGGDEAAVRSIVFFGSRMTGLHLGLNSYELDLASSDSQPLLLTENLSPVLYGAVDALFKDKRVVDGDFNHHYLLTNDGVRIQVAAGYLNTNSYLLMVNKY